MSTVRINFELTDAAVKRAVREDCDAFLRAQVRLRDLLVIGGSTAVFVLALVRESHWLWWAAGMPSIAFALFYFGWLVARWRLPGIAARRLARLAHRQVVLELTESLFVFQTATERLEVRWEEFAGLKKLPTFWIVRLRSGSRIPVPIGALSREAVDILEARIA